MPDFETIRDELKRTRAQLTAKQGELAAARQTRAHRETEFTSAQRSNRAGSNQIREARNRLRAAQQAEDALSNQLKALRAQDAEFLFVYGEVVDPTIEIEKWNAQIPILLLPVRLETRFHQTGDGTELWVRIYPDDCAIDTFEAELSENEFESGRRYWIETWAAGSLEDQRRSAWRNLVASHGSGRAAWIVKTFAPAGDSPKKESPTDVQLVIATSAPPSDEEKDALATYWASVWVANGDQAAIDEALQILEAAPGVGDAPHLIANFQPANFATSPNPPLKRSDVKVSVAWLVLPAAGNLKTRSWTAPARVHVMPDCFVVFGYQAGERVFEKQGRTIASPLVVGPDPAAPANEQIHHDANKKLVVSDDMRWMVDFDRAVEMGLGIRIPLDGNRVNLRNPIDRLFAVGVRLVDDEDGGQKSLEDLLTHQRYGSDGFSFVPQGTPTNNTDAQGAGYNRTDNGDESYDAIFGTATRLQPSGDWWIRPDGQLFAEALGINVKILDGVPHASRTDFAEARALNRALWPATLGYTMEVMLHPIFEEPEVEATRWFYTHFVTGRGFLPAIRIGEQPYGILPISALSNWNWVIEPPDLRIGGLRIPDNLGPFLQSFMRVLDTMRADWTTLTQRVSFVGKDGDPHQLLLDILGLHPASVEFHQRYAESLDHIFNRAKFAGVGAQIMEYIRISALQIDARELLRRLGYNGKVEPDALQRFFFTRAHRLNGPVIDDRPLSELDPIRPYTIDTHNYIAWLADVGRNSFEDLRVENGFIDDRPPSALLYLMLRHALLLGYWDASLRLHQAAGMSNQTAKAMRREPTTIHVSNADETSKSRYVPLYSKDARVSGDPQRTVVERINQVLDNSPAARALSDQLSALRFLRDTPTARLERCLAEHVDTASFRLDAWLLGLVNLQLSALRYEETQAPPFVKPRPGIYLGAYGWLENLKAKPPLQARPLDDALPDLFMGDEPVFRDPTNGGYIFAPSLNQARSAAILRAGYLANASPNAPGALAVNLSSDRVRVALSMIEGIRNGQPLGALLGYQFQRGLHDRHGALELDKFIHSLRQQFPLVSNQMTSTHRDGVAIETIEANNVIDGLKLIEHVRANALYPFGLNLIPATAAERTAINAEVDRLLDAHDALADLALAEGVHQAVLGNYDRVAATLDAYSKGTFPPEPEIIRTPRSGTTLTHRVALHLRAGLDPNNSVSPRSKAQPMVNDWLAGILPAPAAVACQVDWIDPLTGNAEQQIVTQANLRLQPIDLLYIVAPDGQTAMSELDDRIVRRVIAHRSPRADAVLSIQHTVRLAGGEKTFFELVPLLNHLRSLLLRSRPLAATDAALQGEAKQQDDANESIDLARVELAANELVQLRQDILTFDSAGLTIDAVINACVALFERASRFGLQQVGWGFLYEWRRRAFSELLEQVRSVVTRWTEKLTEFDQKLADYNQAAGLTEEQRLLALSQLDLFIAAIATTPRPATAADYEIALAIRRQAFEDKLVLLRAILNTAHPTFSALVTAVRDELPLTDFDNTRFPMEFELPELRSATSSLIARWTDRLQRFDAGVVAYNALPVSTTDEERFAQLESLDLLVAAQVIQPRPATPAAYLIELTARRTAFANKLAAFTTISNSTEPRAEKFLARLEAELPVTDFDTTPFLLDNVAVEIDRTVNDLHARLKALEAEIAKRLAATDEQIQLHNATADPAARVTALQNAGTRLLGEDIKLIPEFNYPAAQAAELTNIYANRTLLDYLTTTKQIAFPVDDWLHGVARVREKLFAWEQAATLTSVFGKNEPQLIPIQLPFKAGDGWLALEFDPAQSLDGERLLYTAHHATAPNPATATCGLLLDEWTELIPKQDETAGLAFHFDRPNSEPPQTWLLVTSPRMRGNWRWTDLTSALDEALKLARLRAVEPAHVDTETYARFLPATTSAVTLYGISIAANYARNNNVMEHVRRDGDG
ncbi:MAG TPA: hypothetical protein VF088_02985 [Pyrinomonadaceae bacterium]